MSAAELPASKFPSRPNNFPQMVAADAARRAVLTFINNFPSARSSLVAGIAGHLVLVDRFSRKGERSRIGSRRGEGGYLENFAPAGSDLRLEKCGKVGARGTNLMELFSAGARSTRGHERVVARRGKKGEKLSARRMRTVQFSCFAKLHARRVDGLRGPE